MRTFEAILASSIILVSAGFAYAANAGIDAKKLYAQQCAMCHGQSGEGAEWLVKSLADGDISKLSLIDQATRQKSDKELKTIILNGFGKMPAQKSSLSEKETDELVKYIRALKK